MKVLHVVGARPNFMKTAAIMAAMDEHPGSFQQVLVHTGQHYDQNMSRVFFDELELPDPDDFLGVGSGTHAAQTARIMLAFEPVLAKHQPDWLTVVGDVNSTLACALVAAKSGVRIAHVEAGLRSGDRSMPEEINRILTDQLADALFTPSRDGDANLLREGIAPEKVYCVGNVMIDTLVRSLPKALQRPTLGQYGLEAGRYVLVTLHRAGNVDDPATLNEILAALHKVAEWAPVIFPVHPRTRDRIQRLDSNSLGSRVQWVDPLGYLDFIALMNSSMLVLTDSGGVQEETTYLGVPCLTVRPNTERPITILAGTNRLVRPACDAIVEAVRAAALRGPKPSIRPEFWDGRAAARLVEVMLNWDARAPAPLSAAWAAAAVASSPGAPAEGH
jgi:UDP-N-acetylglucosamine 2-epimerase (non-hydrolysing)